MADRLVDLLDSQLELAARQVVVARKTGLELLHLGLEVRDVDVLLTVLGQLLLVGKRVHGCVAQERDHGDEELRADHVHLLVAVAHVHDARVVELAFGLQQSAEHRVLAALLRAVVIELLEEVLVLVLGGRVVVLVFHLEHDGDDLVAVLIALAEDEVALGAAARIVVLLKVCVGEGRHAQAVELGLAVLFERLAHHLGGKARLHVAQTLDLLVLIAQDGLVARAHLLDLELVRGDERLLFALVHRLLLRELEARLVALVLHARERLRLGKLRGALLLLELRTQTVCLRARLGPGLLQLAVGLGLHLLQLARGLGLRLRQCGLLHVLRTPQLGTQLGKLGLLLSHGLAQLLGHRLLLLAQGRSAALLGRLHGRLLHLLRACGLGLEACDLRIALVYGLLQLCSGASALHLKRVLALAAGRGLALAQVVRELGIAHLLDDVRVAGLVHREELPAMGAFDLIHSDLDLLLKTSRLRLYAIKERKDVVPAYRTVPVGVHAHVVAQDAVCAVALVVLGALAVDMPVELDGPAPLAVPREHGVVREAQAMALCKAGLDLQVILLGLERVRIRPLGPVLIVVAANQVHMAARDLPAQRIGRLRSGAKREIAQHIQDVLGGDALVDVLDKATVHLLHRGERTMSELHDIRMPKVSIGRKPHHGARLPVCLPGLQFSAHRQRRCPHAPAPTGCSRARPAARVPQRPRRARSGA